MVGRQAPGALSCAWATMTNAGSVTVTCLTMEPNLATSHLVHHIPRFLPTERMDKSVESHGDQCYRFVPFADHGRL
jgi:phage terminase large subunit-like protein